MGVKNGPKSIKNGIKNKSDFKPKTDPRPTTVDGGGRVAGDPVGPVAPGLLKELTDGWDRGKWRRDQWERAENDERTQRKEDKGQKMTNEPRGQKTKSRKKTKWTKRKDIIVVI